MKGYVTTKRGRYYAVIYEGLDPVTGRERRSWHPAGTDREEAERLAERLAGECNGRNDEIRSLTLGAYLTNPLVARQEAHSRYEHLPGLRPQDPAPHPPGPRDDPVAAPAPQPSRGAVRPDAAPRRWAASAVAQDGVRGALDHPRRSQRRRPPRTHQPQRRTCSPRAAPAVDPQGGATGVDRRAATPVPAGGSRSPPVPGVLALSHDWAAPQRTARAALDRPRPGQGHRVHQPRARRGRLRAPRDHAARPTTLAAPSTSTPPPSRSCAAGGPCRPPSTPPSASTLPAGCSPTPTADPIHPHAISQAFDRIARRAGVPVIRLHDLRHTHGTLLIKAGVPVKVVSERLGHANIAFTIETYQHVLPGMQADAARTFEALVAAASAGRATAATPVERPEEHRLNPVDAPPTTKAQVADLGLQTSIGGGGRI